MTPGVTNRKIMKKTQVAHIRYREVISSGETYMPCLSGQSDAEVIELAKKKFAEIPAENVEFEIKRV